MADSLRQMLPPVYRPVFDEFFDKAKPDETRATCGKCAMCDHGAPSPVPMEYFNSDTKCCTYFPQLPNYLVGAILADETPEMQEGKRRIQARIKMRIGITPHWLTRPQKMTLVMLGYGPAFGRAKTLKCPFYDDNNPEGTCSIWRHRETICMTYYCKYVGGQRGYDFWTALKAYLAHVQRQLVRHAQIAVDPKVTEPIFKKNQLSTEDIDDLPPKDILYDKWWGPWVGREEEYYLKCHEWMMNAKAEEFQLNVNKSDEGKHYVKELQSTYEKLENKILPNNLVRNARMKEDHVENKVVVTTYHRFDSFSLDKDLYDVVGLFKAQETLDQNLTRLKGDGIELAPELIEYLFAAGVLVEPTPIKAADAKADNAGELTGRRVALEAILEARKIAAPVTAQRRIVNADRASLDEWIKKAATADNIVDVMGVDPIEDDTTKEDIG